MASEEVRAAAFEKADADMVAVAETIIKRRSGHFDPAIFRDRYQEVCATRYRPDPRGWTAPAAEPQSEKIRPPGGTREARFG